MPVSNAMRACIALCWECRDICQATLYNHCLNLEGPHVAKAHVKAMTDCIQACLTCADFMTRDSDMHRVECGACAEICQACALSCRAVGGPEMNLCAEVCQRCAVSCRDMADMSKAAMV